jgi:hypothetical protein
MGAGAPEHGFPPVLHIESLFETLFALTSRQLDEKDMPGPARPRSYSELSDEIGPASPPWPAPRSVA